MRIVNIGVVENTEILMVNQIYSRNSLKQKLSTCPTIRINLQLMLRNLHTKNAVNHLVANVKIVYDVKIVAVARTVKKLRNQATMHPLKNVYIVNVSVYVLVKLFHLEGITEYDISMCLFIFQSSKSGRRKRKDSLTEIDISKRTFDNQVPRQCYGPECIKEARHHSKYCSDECGMKLAYARIYHVQYYYHNE